MYRCQSTIACLACFALSLPSAFAQAVVNAPVAPDTIYVGGSGGLPCISVIDLNGFGQGTGNPSFDPSGTISPPRWSNFPNNPNLQQPIPLVPPIAPGTSTEDGGSSGVFRLVRDSELDARLVQAPTIDWVGDMMLGQPLDLVYNNAPGPGGCASGGNPCASTAKKIVDVSFCGGSTAVPNLCGGPSVNVVVGGGNPISWAPHPNPPARIWPPTCDMPSIPGAEPSSIENILSPANLMNALVPGDPFGVPQAGIPPGGLLASEQNAYFVGPGSPQMTVDDCPDFMIRQQVGHFLYMTDPIAHEVVVFNSNTFEVLARIPVLDATDLAMGPNLDLLAVTQPGQDSVSFIDIAPASGTFHQVVHTTAVGDNPQGIAWDPGNEDILVCNEGDGSLSILSVASLGVRKVVRRGLDAPFDVAITQRQTNFGLRRDVYFAYILNRDGRVTVFESGPSGSNGWGFDDIIGHLPFRFFEPKAIQPDPGSVLSVWIVHERAIDALTGLPVMDGPALTRVGIEAGLSGRIPLGPGEEPSFRSLDFGVSLSLGSERLTGMPLDLAFDNQVNLGALPGVGSVFSAGTPSALNSKSQVREIGGVVVPTNRARFLFALVERGAGQRAIDVIDISSAGTPRVDTDAHLDGVQSIRIPGGSVLMDYFRQ